MPKFKIVASKSNKKYSLILSAESESEAKEKIHKQGYSILSVQIADDREILGKKFIFEIETEKGLKKGIIVGNDIFKAYVKLVDELGYKVIFLYPEEDEGKLSPEEKNKIVLDLSRGLALQKQGKKINISLKKEENTNDTKQLDDSFYLKKELEQTHWLIEKVITKLDVLIHQKNSYNISPEKLEKLTVIYGSIVTLKKSTNISKLKEIWELALLKIGNIELEALEGEKSQEAKKLLTDTNQLLKKIGSNKQFKEKNKDIGYIFSMFIEGIQEKIQWLKDIRKTLKEKTEKKLIDKDSYSYLKTLLLLEKYNEKLKENNKDFFKNIVSIVFPYGDKQNIKERILTKRRVIQQNISLLKAKKSGKVQSYTLAVKGYNKFIEMFLHLLQEISHFFYYVIYIYSLFFIFYILSVRLWVRYESFEFNFTGVYYFLGVIIVAILGSISRNSILFVFNFVIFWFLFIFSIVNF